MSGVTTIEVQGITLVRARPQGDDSAAHITELEDALHALYEGSGAPVVVDLGSRVLSGPRLAVVLQNADDALGVLGHRFAVVSSHEQTRQSLRNDYAIAVFESLDQATGDLSAAHHRD